MRKERKANVYTAEQSPYQFGPRPCKFNWRVLRDGKPYIYGLTEQQAKNNAERFNRTQPGNEAFATV